MSPERAARRAQRAAMDAAQRRKEQRRSLQLLIGVTVASIGLMVADYLWLRRQAEQRHEQRYDRGGKTNPPASTVPLTRQSQTTNHE